jgi:hypothetical protein
VHDEVEKNPHDVTELGHDSLKVWCTLFLKNI